MADEYISREDVLDIIEDMRNNHFILMGERANLAFLKSKITELPVADVQPVPQWISVKERLPEENQKCLVYRDINADLKITTGIWHSEWKAFDGLRHGTRLEDTIAWMPLLEPPKDGDTK